MDEMYFAAQLQILGTEIRQRRFAKGYSQESFADACGLDRTYVGGVERGERNLSFRNLLKIAEALGIQPAELLSQIIVKSGDN